MTTLDPRSIPLRVLRTKPAPRSPSPRRHPATAAHDPLGRGVGYLRISVSKACAMRCAYCRPAAIHNPRDETRLTPLETQQLVRTLVAAFGLRKVRLTGGDPTSRPDLTDVITRVAAIPGLLDLAMTTNGLTLERRARDYAAAGLHRVNVSLDTLDPQRFHKLTGVDGLDRVVRGLHAANRAGLRPIKINTVVVRGANDLDLRQLIEFAAALRHPIRLIELMPMGPLADQWSERYVPEPEMRERIGLPDAAYQPITQGRDAARRYHLHLPNGLTADLGFITPMSCNFCSSCDRLRIAADGAIYPCLMDRPMGSLLDALRPRLDKDLLLERIADAYRAKQDEHPQFGHAVMTHIGG